MASASPTSGCVTTRRTVRTARTSGNTVVSAPRSWCCYIGGTLCLEFYGLSQSDCGGDERESKTFQLSQNVFLICPQLGGRAPAISSDAATEPASRENTSVTTCTTAWTGPTRHPAVSRPGGGPLFCVLDLGLLWHFNQFAEIKRLVD